MLEFVRAACGVVQCGVVSCCVRCVVLWQPLLSTRAHPRDSFRGCLVLRAVVSLSLHLIPMARLTAAARVARCARFGLARCQRHAARSYSCCALAVCVWLAVCLARVGLLRAR